MLMGCIKKRLYLLTAAVRNRNVEKLLGNVYGCCVDSFFISRILCPHEFSLFSSLSLCHPLYLSFSFIFFLSISVCLNLSQIIFFFSFLQSSRTESRVTARTKKSQSCPQHLSNLMERTQQPIRRILQMVTILRN